MSILHKKSVVILGLGRNGGGIASAQYAAACGASSVFISDLQSEEKLAPALEQLSDVLRMKNTQVETGRHSMETIAQADVVIKNPAVPPQVPVLSECTRRGTRVETDISLFLRHVNSLRGNSHTPEFPRIVAITGTKGKSSTGTAWHRWNIERGVTSSLAGNITSSPLLLLMNQQLPEKIYREIVLELSSFQLGDLHRIQHAARPKHVSESLYESIHMAILTNIFPDHQNYYASMQEYIHDKMSLFYELPASSTAVLPFAQHNEISLPRCGIVWHDTSEIQNNFCPSAWHDALNNQCFSRADASSPPRVLCDTADIPATVMRQNIAVFAAACLASRSDVPQQENQWHRIFTVPHRKEFIGCFNGITFYNDSAATIPQAMNLTSFLPASAAGVSKPLRLHLLAGGTDKNLDPGAFVQSCRAFTGVAYFNSLSVYLLAGTYTDKILPQLTTSDIQYLGPFISLQNAVRSAVDAATPGDVVALSPGCASFGMFINEFDRGDSFRSLVRSLYKL